MPCHPLSVNENPKNNILSHQNGVFIHHTFDNNVTGLLNNLTDSFFYIQSNDTIINTISDTRCYQCKVYPERNYCNIHVGNEYKQISRLLEHVFYNESKL